MVKRFDDGLALSAIPNPSDGSCSKKKVMTQGRFRWNQNGPKVALPEQLQSCELPMVATGLPHGQVASAHLISVSVER